MTVEIICGLLVICCFLAFICWKLYNFWQDARHDLNIMSVELMKLQRAVREAKQDETRYNAMPDADVDAFLRK